MDTFYIVTLTIAIVLLIIILTYIGLKIRGKNLNQSFPPQAASCPDNWVPATGGNCYIPSGDYDIKSTNTYGLGVNTIDFSDAGWSQNNTSSICNKNAWATKYGIHWDGITNYNGC
jgi:hypothetical protein